MKYSRFRAFSYEGKFQDFEDALLKDKPGQENLFLSYLTIDILKGCLYTDDIR